MLPQTPSLSPLVSCPRRDGWVFKILGSSSCNWLNRSQLMLIVRGRAAVMCREQDTAAYLTDSSTQLTLGESSALNQHISALN